MKQLIIISALIAMLGVGSCKKTTGLPPTAIASFNIVNVIPDAVNGVTPIFGTLDSPYHYADLYNSIYYSGSFNYAPENGVNSLAIYQSTDTPTAKFDNYIFNGNITVKTGAIYSLFLGGDTSKVDTLLTQDIIPFYAPSDSSVGIRFVNMSTGSMPFSVTLNGNPASQTEFSNIAYKGVTGWNKYPGTSAVGGGYTFVLRDQATGDSLTSFTWNYTLYRSNTIVVSGSEAVNATYPLNLFQMNNY